MPDSPERRYSILMQTKTGIPHSKKVPSPAGAGSQAPRTAVPVAGSRESAGGKPARTRQSTRKPAGDHAEESMRLQLQLLNAVEQAVIATDLKGGITFWNRFAEALYGWTADEARGRNIVEVIAAPGLPEPARALMAGLGRGENRLGEFLVRRRDGLTFTAYMSASPLPDNGGAPLGTAVISYDSAQAQVREANRLLARASALLTASVDYETQLTTLAQLAVPQLADWCAVHLLQTDGSLAQVALAQAETAKAHAAREWLQDYLPYDEAYGLPAVLRSGEPKLVIDVFPELWTAGPVDNGRRRIPLEAGIKSYMIVPLIARPQTLGTITFVAAESGRRFDVNALALAENLVSHIAIHLDKTRLYRESQQLNAELEQRVGERTAELRKAVAQFKHSEATVQTLFRISKKLNATLDLDTLLDELAQEAILIVVGESGFAGLCDGDALTVRKYFRKGVAIPFDYAWPAGSDIPGWVLQYKVPYGTSDAASDPVMLHELAINADVRSLICTPILDSLGEVIGYFDIRNKKGGAGFTLSDQNMLMALSPAASIAIQNALAYKQRLRAESDLKESFEQLRALAANLQSVREEEGTRIARELHDELGQALTALKFDLAWLTNQLASKDATFGERARAVSAQMDTMIKTVRRIATELRPGMLDDLGLVASLEWQAREFQKRTGVQCEVSAPQHDLALARAPSTALFRIFQETLTNVARHAEARHVKVKLESARGMLTLRIHDDGRGILAREITGTRSLGLLGMRERAALLGGSFAVRGTPREGTTVTVSIPLTHDK
jgi:PAS domain S-box-containing protein